MVRVRRMKDFSTFQKVNYFIDFKTYFSIIKFQAKKILSRSEAIFQRFLELCKDFCTPMLSMPFAPGIVLAGGSAAAMAVFPFGSTALRYRGGGGTRCRFTALAADLAALTLSFGLSGSPVPTEGYGWRSGRLDAFACRSRVRDSLAVSGSHDCRMFNDGRGRRRCRLFSDSRGRNHRLFNGNRNRRYRMLSGNRSRRYRMLSDTWRLHCGLFGDARDRYGRLLLDILKGRRP